MTPDIFRQSKNLFLVFPPGTGGNHVANMLSMHPEFEPRYTHENYYEDMVYTYKKIFGGNPKNSTSCIAHFSDLENLQEQQLMEFESKIVNSKKNYIFCSHAVEYIMKNIEDKLTPYQNRICCLFSNPTGSNSFVNHRMHVGAWYGGEPDDQIHIDINVKLLYNKETFIQRAKIDPNLIFTLDTDLFYSIDGYDYLHDTIKTNLGIELPEICREMHIQYIKFQEGHFT